MKNPLTFWHGAQGWTGRAEIRPPRAGCYECGPGIYLTNQWATAKKYSKGPGQLIEVVLGDQLLKSECWLEGASMSIGDMKTFVGSLSRVPSRAQILEDIDACAERVGQDVIPANVLVNLFVNHEAGGGKNGVALAGFLASKGIMASHTARNRQEDWITVFDPTAIKHSRKVKPEEVHERRNELDFPKLRDQLDQARCCASRLTRADGSAAPLKAKQPSSHRSSP